MTMPNIDSIQSALSGITSLLVAEGAVLAPELKSALETSNGRPSPVDRIVEVGESLYTHAAILSDQGKRLCGSLMRFASMNGWHGLAEGENRGGRIFQAMARDTGEEPPMGMDWPAAETDPDPKAPAVVPDAPAAPEA